MKIRLFRLPANMYAKMLISFTLIISILIIGVAVFFSYNYSKSSIRMINRMNEKLLSQISYSSTYMNELAINFTNSIYFNNAVTPLLYTKEEDMFPISNAIRSLDSQTISNSYIHSVYTFNRKLDLIVSTETNSMYSQKSFYDQEMVRIINEIQDDRLKLVAIPRMVPIQESDEKQKKMVNVYTFLMFSPMGNDSNPVDSAIIVNMKADWLRDTIAGLKSKSDNQSDIIVIDAEGRIVSDAASDKFLTNAADIPVLTQVMDLPPTSNSDVIKADGKRMMINYSRSDAPQWQFISITPYEYVTSTVRSAQWTALIVCIAILLAGLWLARFTSRTIYSPLGQFLSTMRQKEAGQDKWSSEIGEVSFLNRVFSQLSRQKDELELQTRAQKQPLKNKIVQNMLKGNHYLTLSETMETFRMYDIRLRPEQKFCLFILKIDGYKSMVEQFDERDQDLLRFGITNIASEVIGEEWSHEAISMENDHICIILNERAERKEPLTRFRDMEEAIEQIQLAVKTYLRISLSGALIEEPCEFGQLDTVYERLLNVSMNRITFGHGSRLTPESLLKLDAGPFKIPTVKEKMLLDHLKLGHLDKALVVYSDISAALRRTVYDNIVAYVFYLMHTIYNSMQTSAENENIRFSTIFNDFVKNVSYFETMDEIDEAFIRLFETIVSRLDKSKTNRVDMLMQHITTLIEKNYSDNNLSLSIIANQMDMSSVYLGKLFKETTGRSVAELITDTRMQKIKHLLETSQLSTKEIIEQVGLEESNYFYILFKKYFGVSLSQFRDDLRFKQSEDE